jgi:hypothetical protein
MEFGQSNDGLIGSKVSILVLFCDEVLIALDSITLYGKNSEGIEVNMSGRIGYNSNTNSKKDFICEYLNSAYTHKNHVFIPWSKIQYMTLLDSKDDAAS